MKCCPTELYVSTTSLLRAIVCGGSEGRHSAHLSPLQSEQDPVVISLSPEGDVDHVTRGHHPSVGLHPAVPEELQAVVVRPVVDSEM